VHFLFKSSIKENDVIATLCKSTWENVFDINWLDDWEKMSLLLEHVFGVCNNKLTKKMMNMNMTMSARKFQSVCGTH
jgi:hypothetical protein